MWNDNIIKKATEDERLTVSHMALLFAIIILCRRENGYKSIQTSRKTLMAKSHIGSLPTYHKSLKHLMQYGYIEYFPSFHPRNGSKIIVIS